MCTFRLQICNQKSVELTKSVTTFVKASGYSSCGKWPQFKNTIKRDPEISAWNLSPSDSGISRSFSPQSNRVGCLIRCASLEMRSASQPRTVLMIARCVPAAVKADAARRLVVHPVPTRVGRKLASFADATNVASRSIAATRRRQTQASQKSHQRKLKWPVVVHCPNKDQLLNSIGIIKCACAATAPPYELPIIVARVIPRLIEQPRYKWA